MGPPNVATVGDHVVVDSHRIGGPTIRPGGVGNSVVGRGVSNDPWTIGSYIGDLPAVAHAEEDREGGPWMSIHHAMKIGGIHTDDVDPADILCVIE